MTRARQRASERYPKMKDGRQRYIICTDEDIRRVYAQGYRKAEKDLGWISVKERLPDPSEEWVVACVEVNGICTCLALVTYDEETKEWHTDDWEDGEQEVYNPDYWMPIPNKVKEDKK